MSTTRKSESGKFRQERFCSSPEFERGLMGNLVARRCGVLERDEDRELIWTLQKISHTAGGLKSLAQEVYSKYVDRIGTASMRALSIRRGQICDAEKVKRLRDDLPTDEAGQFMLKGEHDITDILCSPSRPRDDEWDEQNARAILLSYGDDALEKKSQSYPSSYPAKKFLDLCVNEFSVAAIERYLAELCLDPARTMDGGPWWFHELIVCVRDLLAQRLQALAGAGVVTELGQLVFDTLDYTLATGCLSLIDGHARMGKTFAAKAWCELHPGRARYVQVPSTGDDIGFFRSIAKALGVSINLNSKAQELRQRIEETLQVGDLVLVFDESHWLWPSSTYRDALPGRLLWIMTALVNCGVPVALVTTPQFLKTQKAIERRSNWTSEQFIGRIGHYQPLPQSLSEHDLTCVARNLLPEGDETSIEILVRYAQGSAKYLAGIETAVRRAQYLAIKDGRRDVRRADIKRAIGESVIPSDSALMSALAEPQKPSRRRVNAHLIDDLPDVNSRISAPVPARATTDFADITPGRSGGNIRQTQSAVPLVSVAD